MASRVESITLRKCAYTSSSDLGFAFAGYAKSLGWRNPLHYREWRSTYRDAGLGVHPHSGNRSWELVLFIRSLRPFAQQELTQQSSTAVIAHYVGSAACEKCHQEIYARWKKTPMANVVRDPRAYPNAVIPDLASNTVAQFSLNQVAFVYGSIWKQRYFTKIGDDYFRCPSSGMSAPATGFHITCPGRRIGGRRTTLRTICIGPPAPPATVATPSITTSIPNRLPNGMSGVSVATDRAASMCLIPSAVTLSILPTWIRSPRTTRAFNATRRGGRPRFPSRGNIMTGRLVTVWVCGFKISGN